MSSIDLTNKKEHEIFFENHQGGTLGCGEKSPFKVNGEVGKVDKSLKWQLLRPGAEFSQTVSRKVVAFHEIFSTVTHIPHYVLTGKR